MFSNQKQDTRHSNGYQFIFNVSLEENQFFLDLTKKTSTILFKENIQSMLFEIN